MGVGAGPYMYVVVVQKFTFAISSPDEFLLKNEWWGTDMVICLEQGANDLHMVQLMPLPPHHLLLQ